MIAFNFGYELSERLLSNRLIVLLYRSKFSVWFDGNCFNPKTFWLFGILDFPDFRFREFDPLGILAGTGFTYEHYNYFLKNISPQSSLLIITIFWKVQCRFFPVYFFGMKCIFNISKIVLVENFYQFLKECCKTQNILWKGMLLS